MPKLGKIITVTSMKGGVGKTTTILQLAATFANMSKRVLIIDLDLYNGDISFLLNLESKMTIFNLYDDITNNRYKLTSYKNYIVKYNDYIDCLVAPKDPRQAAKIEVKYLENVLQGFASNYDVVLIDASHILDITKMIALELSSTILNIFTNDSMDIKRTKNFVSICRNMEVDNVHLVLNNAISTRNGYFNDDAINNIIKQDIAFTIPKSFYINNIDSDIINNKLYERISRFKNKGSSYQILATFINNLLEEKGASNNEKE